MNISGSFGHAAGGGLPVDLTMPAQGSQGSPLNQVTPTSPNFDPNLVPMAPSQAAPPPQAPGMPPGVVPQATQSPPMADPQEKIIVMALTKQLERLDKRKQMDVLNQLQGVVNPQPMV